MKMMALKQQWINARSMSMAVLTTAVLMSGCQSQLLKNEPIPEPRYIPKVVLGQAQTLTILPQRVPCQTALPMQCLQAKMSDGNDVILIPYDAIEGFSARSGVTYQISVRPQIDDNTQKSIGRWSLQSILSQQ